MEKECKKILLLKGLQPLNEDQFSMVKSLMDSDLGLTPKMKEEYNKVKIADLMQKKFRGITCVDKLLELLKDIEGLEDTVKTIKNERRKVMKKYKVQGPAPMRKRWQEASSTSESPSTMNEASESVDDTPATQKKKKKTTNNDKSKTTHEWKQLPEHSGTGAQSPGSIPQPPQMPPPTPGSSSATKKRKAQTKKPAQPVMMPPTQGWGQLGQPSTTGALSPGSIPQSPPPTPSCSSSTKKRKAQTIKPAQPVMKPPMQGWGQLGPPSVTGALSPGSIPQSPQMPPPTPGCSSSTKKRKAQTTKPAQPVMMPPMQGWGQLGQPSATGVLSPGSIPQSPPPTPSCSSSTKKKKAQTIKPAQPVMMLPMQGWGQLGQPSVTGVLSPGSIPQSPPPTPSCSSSTKGEESYFQKKKAQSIKTEKPERMLPTQGWGQLGQPSVTGAPSPQMPTPTPGCSSSTKGAESFFQIKKIPTVKTEKSEMMLPTQGWGQLGQPSVTGALAPGSFPQSPQMHPPAPGCSSSTKKPRLKAVPTKASREEGLQTGPKEVMVLKATEPFAYDVTGGVREMFHATVATESQFFQVKVFHVSLKEKFIPKKVIAISHYIGRNGFLEVYNASSVSDVNPDRKMDVSSRLIQNANATPKIKDLHSEEPGIFVNGVYQVHKKRVLDECIILYEIQDKTGTMDVRVYGRLTKVNCEEGDKLTLICFELSGLPRQLRSVTHSFIKVIKPRKIKKEQLNPDFYMQASA